MTKQLIIAVLALSTAFLSACSIYRLDTRQGNALDAEAVAQVELGMTRAEVRQLIGSPAINDSFHPNRDDYVYFFKEKGRGEPQRAHVMVVYERGVVAKLSKTLPDEAATPTATK